MGLWQKRTCMLEEKQLEKDDKVGSIDLRQSLFMDYLGYILHALQTIPTKLLRAKGIAGYLRHAFTQGISLSHWRNVKGRWVGWE